MVVVRPGGIGPGGVAAGAEPITLQVRTGAVGIVAVGADHALLSHAALQKRSVDIDFLQDLAVGIIEVFFQQAQGVGVQQRRSMDVVLADESPPRVAAGAHLRLGRGGQPRGAPGLAGFLIAGPGCRLGFLEADGQPQVGDFRPGLPPGTGLRPLYVRRARSVAGLAGHIHLGPAGLIGVGRAVEVLAQAGRMALGAGAVPILGDPGPEEDVVRSNVLPVVEVKPSLAALGSGPGIPAEGQALEPPSGKLHQVLLQGVRSEGVLDLEFFDSSRGPFGRDQELAVPAVEPGGHAEVGQGRVLEIPQNGLVAGRVHGQIMMGTDVGGVLLGVAGLAGFPAGVVCAAGMSERFPAARPRQQDQGDDGKVAYGERYPGGANLKQSGF